MRRKPHQTPSKLMVSKSQKKPTGHLHSNNPHQGRYHFDQLCEALPALIDFLKPNPYGDQTIDFADPQAVLHLNKALLAQFYHVKFWGLPEGYLCPPIPGRADYIHYLADLLRDTCSTGKASILDIGTGANLIYPIIGSQAYSWNFVASDTDKTAVESARLIAEANPNLKKKIKVIHQTNKNNVFQGVIKESDYFEATLCNPPFHRSEKDAKAGSERKWRNLKGKDFNTSSLNFGGKNNELWCEGGERAFVKAMILESVKFQSQVGWFTSLLSKAENLKPLKEVLTKIGANEVRVIPMAQGQKVSRILAWRFE